MIHYNTLVNALLVILLIHLIIVNLRGDSGKVSGISEYFTGHEDKEKSGMAFLQDLNGGDSDMEAGDDAFIGSSMVGSCNSPKKSGYRKSVAPKNRPNTVTPANTYEDIDRKNQPNFESNVLDYTKFYIFNNSDAKHSSMKMQGRATSAARERGVVQINNPNVPGKIAPKKLADRNLPMTPPPISPMPLTLPDNGRNPVRPTINAPDRWEYANELPMNGGLFGSIVGVDDSEGLFGSYDANAVSIKKCAQEVIARIPHDDLRKPIVYN